MRARGSRSNARGDRRLQLVLLPRLFAQGRAWRLVTPIQASFVALRGSGEMSERSTALLARTARYPQSVGGPKRHPQIS
jgi:hypothetical protein